MDDRQIIGIRNVLRKQAEKILLLKNDVAQLQEFANAVTEDIKTFKAKQEGDFQRLDGMCRYAYKVTKHPAVFGLAGLTESIPRTSGSWEPKSEGFTFGQRGQPNNKLLRNNY